MNAGINHDLTTKKGKGLNKCHSGNNLRVTTRLEWLEAGPARSLCCVRSLNFLIKAIRGCGGVINVESFLIDYGFILGI